MERLWAPWRGTYVSGAGVQEGCFLCAAASDADDPLVVARDEATVTLLNRYPYNPGHVMVAPRTHVRDLIAAGDTAAAMLMVAARRAMRVIAGVMQPDGFNVGVNHGGAAGASVAHLHLHVVPRWGGDTNFMPVVGRTKVLPQLLADTRLMLAGAWPAG